jgi:hypothetical protein
MATESNEPVNFTEAEYQQIWQLMLVLLPEWNYNTTNAMTAAVLEYSTLRSLMLPAGDGVPVALDQQRQRWRLRINPSGGLIASQS